MHSPHTGIHARVKILGSAAFPWENRCLGGVGNDLGLLADDIEHAVLESLLVLAEAVLLPDEVVRFGIEVVAFHALVEQADAELVVGLLFEFQATAVLHVLFEFNRLALAEIVQGSLQLLLLDILILLVLVLAGKVLPRERPLKEIEDNVPNGFEVVTARLLLAHMRGQARVTSSPRQVLAFDEWNVHTLAVLETLGQTEVDNVDVVLSNVGASY